MLSVCRKGAGPSTCCLDTGLWLGGGKSVSPALPDRLWSLSLLPTAFVPSLQHMEGTSVRPRLCGQSQCSPGLAAFLTSSLTSPIPLLRPRHFKLLSSPLSMSACDHRGLPPAPNTHFLPLFTELSGDISSVLLPHPLPHFWLQGRRVESRASLCPSPLFTFCFEIGSH